LQGSTAETLVRQLVAEVRHCQQTEQNMRKLLDAAFTALPPSGHLQLVTIPGIGAAGAAVLTAKIVDIDRFQSPEQLVGYFGIFPEENTSGVDKHGKPIPPGTLRMSHKGNDLVRAYLWNAARVGICHNPALRALYRRLKAKGKRGDVALGQCMRKLLHLVFAVWKTNRPFDEHHFAWEPSDTTMSQEQSCDMPMSQPPVAAPANASNEAAVGHKRDVPADKVVTTATATVKPAPAAVKPRPKVAFAFLRGQISLEQVLRHLGLFEQLRGQGQHRRGPCPLHAPVGGGQHTFSVHLGKKVFQCFDARCAAHGNVLDLWAAVHRLPLYEAALHLAETFHLSLNREEEPVRGTRKMNP
jgi:hypothetical protein